MSNNNQQQQQQEELYNEIYGNFKNEKLNNNSNNNRQNYNDQFYKDRNNQNHEGNNNSIDNSSNNNNNGNGYKPYRQHEQRHQQRRENQRHNPYNGGGGGGRGGGHHHQHHNQQHGIVGQIGGQYNDRFNNQQYGQVNKSIYEHYNNRSNTSRNDRQASKIIKMRSINNWIKSILIQKHSRIGDRVLDICGGKLGDLQKWMKQSIGRLFVADIALDSLRHGMGRLNDEIAKQQQPITFDSTFVCCDCFSPKLLESLPPATSKVDLVSCQFALHYSFRSEESARQLLHNVTSLLEEGGYFIGTIPDACYIVKNCRDSKSNRIGNELYSIKFKSLKADNENEIDVKKFGCAYDFFLEDAIDGLEEYLVHMDILVELASQYHLELVSDEDFHSFIRREIYAKPENTELFQRMNRSQSISQEEWDALSIYRLFAFKKRTTTTTTTSDENTKNRPTPQPKKLQPYKESDIIINL
ncbi:hypothetical protein PPL_11439 [Heterostelium album PN500]|uniref:mRNA cap guanine-N(7) methyltransferase n=1 Tax=Heterostelium pallidum (strain ATCC 26659 / Pp 5 / PN500) TaxID=670386 RepID=D3BTE5_HETP5|nr:hypothetical protein PPL_11439 [Heterostelium album PN500]EFA75362.1 hypothetical protein PPL_11439 [Heterostelium album PN500]|eukprot:XP_020427496.1 hypothetical protein PPL_11439 [Heterostelium album PN500]